MRVIDADLATLIADFAADEQSTSLELPHMTTGQRKATKKNIGGISRSPLRQLWFGS
jgi:hypothetical protein